MKYGIGITTRNRPEFLASSLQEHAKYAPTDSRFVIVDDSSDPQFDCSHLVDDFRQKVPNVEFRRAYSRLGIAKAKNACLARLTDCDHVFLFDDDAWPRQEGWADKWVLAAETHGIGHSMYMATTAPGCDNPLFRAETRKIGRIGEGDTAFTAYSNCFGVALHFSRQCLDALGGYDSERAVNVYGFEHAQMSQRAKVAGFTKGMQYAAPSIIEDLIYSIDITYGWHHELPGFDAPWIGVPHGASTSKEESSAHQRNAGMMSYLEPYIPLIDPLG